MTTGDSRAIDRESLSQLDQRIALLEGMSEGFLALDPDYRLTYVNAAAERIAGSPREALLGQQIWSVFALEGTVAEPAYRRAMADRVPTRFELFYQPWFRWFEVSIDPAASGGLAVYFRDVTDRKKHETVLSGQKRALELAVNGAPVREVLEVLVRTIERHASRGVIASILLLDEAGLHVRYGAAPHLPEEFSRAIDGAPIGPRAGSCGTAAYTRRRIVVSDIENDPLWDDYRELARRHGLRSCWSTPIVSARNTVLGTFALYHKEALSPAPGDFEIVDLLTHTAAVIIERHRESEERVVAEKRLALQIEGIERLHALAMRLARETDLHKKLEAILSTATEVHSTNRGILCLFDEESESLEACSSLGFDPSVAEELVRDNSRAAPSLRAFETRERVVVEDIERDEKFAPLRQIARSAGFRAVHSTPIQSSSGEVVGALSVHFDQPQKPTELQMRLADLCAAHAADAIIAERGERALRESEEKFRLLADNMSQLAWMADGSGSIFWYNKRWFDYTGTTIDQSTGWGWTAVHHPDYVEQVVKKIQHSWDSGEPWEDTFPLRGKDGGYRWFLSRAVPVRDPDGRVVRWFGTNTDITAVREVEVQLQQAKNAAEEANRAKDEFLAMLGHELRNPLAPIVTALELAKLTGDDHIGQLDVVERQVQHLVRLVEDLLDMARFTRGKVALAAERIELADVVSRALEISRPLIEEKQHQLDVDVPHEGLPIFADPIRLTQIAANLISNAAKYTNARGRIAVSARTADAMVVLSVKDDGIGLAPEACERVFEEFVQEREALGSARGGLGLGLAIVKKLVQLHGGSVEAHSEGRGKGSEFIVRLPIASAEKAEAPRVETKVDALAHGRRVLVVDDNEDAAMLLMHTLQRMGYSVTVAYDGASALDVASEFRPDIALVDLNLPKVSGYDLAARLRAIAGLEKIRLIAATGHGEDSVREKTAAAGFNAHLVKPIAIRTLARTIDEIVR